MKPIKIVYFLLFVILLTNIFDIYATYKAMSLGIEEANLVADWFIIHTGFIGLTAFKLIFISILCLSILNVTKFIIVGLGFVASIYIILSIIHLNFLF